MNYQVAKIGDARVAWKHLPANSVYQMLVVLSRLAEDEAQRNREVEGGDDEQ